MKTNFKLVCLMSIAVIYCSGCSHLHEWMETGTVGPEYSPPAAQVSTTWIEQNGPYAIASSHGMDDPQWWRVFEDPELNQLVQSANCNYLPLKLASLQVLARQQQRAIAKGNLFPQQQAAVAEYQRLQFSENGNQIGIAGLGNSFDLFRVGFNASWEVDLWGRLRKQVEAADAQIGVSVEDWHDVQLSLNAEVVSTYLQIRLLQQRILIARQQVEAQQETLRIAGERARIGTESRLDVTQAAATVAATEASIPQLQAALQLANNQLCILLGIPPRDLFNEQNTGSIPFVPQSVIVGLPRDLLRRRPDVRRAEREVASQNALIGVAVADLFPQFTLRGQFDWQAFKFRDVFDGASFGGALAPGFSWQILNYGRIKNNIELERNRLEQALVRYRQTVLDANREAEDAAVSFAKKQEELVALTKAVEATRESLEIANKAYRIGDIDLDRVNNLRKDLIRQLDLMTTAQGEAAVALVTLYRSIGGGWAPNSQGMHGQCTQVSSAVSQPTPQGFATPQVTQVSPVAQVPPVAQNAAESKALLTPQAAMDRVAWSQAGAWRLEEPQVNWSESGSPYNHGWGVPAAPVDSKASIGSMATIQVHSREEGGTVPSQLATHRRVTPPPSAANFGPVTSPANSNFPMDALNSPPSWNYAPPAALAPETVEQDPALPSEWYDQEFLLR